MITILEIYAYVFFNVNTCVMQNEAIDGVVFMWFDLSYKILWFNFSCKILWFGLSYKIF
jgi:hypothetical protein